MIRFSRRWRRAAVAAMVAMAGVPASPASGSGRTPSSADPVPAGSGPPPSPTGIYLRAGLALDRSSDTRFRDVDRSCPPPPALYGCTDGVPHGTLGNLGTMGGLVLGVGYGATPAIRLEALIRYRPRLAFEGRADFLEPGRRQDVSADLTSVTGLFAAYLDLNELGMPRIGSLRPFIGAGAGLSRIDIEETRMEFPRTTTVVPGGRSVDVAWMVTAGFAVPLGDKLALDLAWRYTDDGTAETGRGKGRIVWRDGSREPLALDLAGTRGDLRGHGLLVSLRYAL